jgi:hypothetical protein
LSGLRTSRAGAPGLAAHAEARAVALLAATLHTEAALRPVRAIEGLAAVVAHRARLASADPAARIRYAPALPAEGRAPWPALVAAACRAPFLFPCWRDAAGRAQVAAAMQEEGRLAATCRRIALRVLAGTLGDPTGGAATHWHAAEDWPGWAAGRIPLCEIGGLVFHRLD